MMSLGEKYIRKRNGLSNSAPLSRASREQADYFDEEFKRAYGMLKWFDTDVEAAQYIQRQSKDAFYILLGGPKEMMKKEYCVKPMEADPDVLLLVGGLEEVTYFIGGDDCLEKMRKDIKRYKEWDDKETKE